MQDEIVLRMEGITKVFPGVTALNKVNFELKRGEVHALIGENGAGKSTLMKILLGIYSKDGGKIFLRGKEVVFSSPNDALKNGISMIHQEISLVPQMDVAENIWLGREELFFKGGLLDVNARYQKTKELLAELDLAIDVTRKVSSYSVAQMQMIEIARAISYNSDIIIMDEPTSALTNRETEKLYEIVKKLTIQGVALIFISHKLEESFEICDRITVLRDGTYVGTKSSKELTMDDLVTMIVGREIKNMFPKKQVPIGNVIFEVKNLTYAGVFQNISFQLKKGEILGFCGLVGAGRTEIVSSIFGLHPLDFGEIYIEGQKVEIRSPEQAIQYGIGMVTEDRLRAGSLHNQSIITNMSLAYFPKLCNALQFYDAKRELHDFYEYAKKMQLKYASPNAPMSSLSGGNQQKVIIGRWLLTAPKILILDEPTRGIDVGSKSEIHRIMGELVENGFSIILVSSEMPELLGVSDRILVISNGQIVYETETSKTDSETLIKYAFNTQHTNSSEVS